MGKKHVFTQEQLARILAHIINHRNFYSNVRTETIDNAIKTRNILRFNETLPKKSKIVKPKAGFNKGQQVQVGSKKFIIKLL